MAKTVTEKAAEEAAASEVIDRKIAEPGRLARRHACAYPCGDREGGSRCYRRSEMARRAGLVTRRHSLHGRNLQKRREDDICEGRFAGGPAGLFNSSLEGNTRRAIDFHEGDVVDEKALAALIRAAVALNVAVASGKKRAGK